MPLTVFYLNLNFKFLQDVYLDPDKRKAIEADPSLEGLYNK